MTHHLSSGTIRLTYPQPLGSAPEALFAGQCVESPEKGAGQGAVTARGWPPQQPEKRTA